MHEREFAEIAAFLRDDADADILAARQQTSSHAHAHQQHSYAARGPALPTASAAPSASAPASASAASVSVSAAAVSAASVSAPIDDPAHARWCARFPHVSLDTLLNIAWQLHARQCKRAAAAHRSPALLQNYVDRCADGLTCVCVGVWVWAPVCVERARVRVMHMAGGWMMTVRLCRLRRLPAF